jgi:hypothetical protein
MGTTFLVSWIIAAIIGFKSKLSVTLSIGGGFLVALIPMVIYGFIFEPPPSKTASTEATDYSYIAMNQERVRSKLKDPNSAQFSGVFISKAAGAPIICGKINAKNSFGGYTGYQRFISGGTIQVLETEMRAGEMDKLWLQLCAH